MADRFSVFRLRRNNGGDVSLVVKVIIGCVLIANRIATLSTIVRKIRSAEANFTGECLLTISRNEPLECYTYWTAWPTPPTYCTSTVPPGEIYIL